MAVDATPNVRRMHLPQLQGSAIAPVSSFQGHAQAPVIKLMLNMGKAQAGMLLRLAEAAPPAISYHWHPAQTL